MELWESQELCIWTWQSTLLWRFTCQYRGMERILFNSLLVWFITFRHVACGFPFVLMLWAAQTLGASLYFTVASFKIYIYIFPKQGSDYIIICLEAFDDDCSCLLGSKWLWLFIIPCQMKLTIKWDLPFIRERVRGWRQPGSSLLLGAHRGSLEDRSRGSPTTSSWNLKQRWCKSMQTSVRKSKASLRQAVKKWPVWSCWGEWGTYQGKGDLISGSLLASVPDFLTVLMCWNLSSPKPCKTSPGGESASWNKA